MNQEQDFWDTFRQDRVLSNNNVFLIRDANENPYVKKIYKKEDKLLKALIKIKKLNSPYLLRIFLIEEQEKQIVVLHEYCSTGSLEQIMLNTQQQIIKCFDDMIKGVSDLKSIDLMHRDIKPGNVVYDGYNYKLIDFETVKHVGQEEIRQVQSRIGTEIYMAPEVFYSQPYTSKCDIWSIGCVIYYLVHRNHLFYQNNQFQAPNFNREIPESQFSELIRKILVKEDDRITLQDLKQELKLKFKNQYDCSISIGQQSTNTSSNNSISLQNNPVINFFCKKFTEWTSQIQTQQNQLNLLQAWILFLQQESQAGGYEQSLLKTVNLEYLFQLTLYRQQQTFAVNNHERYNQFMTKEELVEKLRQYSCKFNVVQRKNFNCIIKILSQ